MSRPLTFRLCLLAICALTSCTRDPNVRKQKYFESGERYYDKKQFREAAIQYSNALQLDSRFAGAHYKLGESYLKLHDYSRAFFELARTLELAPDNNGARLDLANLLISARDLAQAKPLLDTLREKQPRDPLTYQAWANYYTAQDNIPAATQEMINSIAADPNRADSHLSLALLQMRAGQFDPAEASFKKAAALDPGAVNAELALAGFYQSRGRMPEAEQQFRHAVEVAPSDTAPRAAYVRFLMAENRRSDAEAYIRQTIKEIPGNSESYRMLGDFYLATGDLDRAAAEYSSLSHDHPKDIQVTKNYVQLLVLKNQLDEAARLNDQILKTNPRDIEGLIYRGQIQIRHNDAAGAVETLQSALKNDPNNAIAHYQLGIALNLQQSAERAEAEWREAVRLRPDLTDAQRALASSELGRGDFDALIHTADQIIAAQPSSGDGYLLRASANMRRQRYPETEQDLHTAQSKAPNSPAPLVQLGTLRLLQKKLPEAQKFFQQALDKDPSSTDALSGLMNSYLAAQQTDKAIAAARDQIAKAPNSAYAYNLLGTILFETKRDLSGAETSFRKAVELDRSNSESLAKLGRVLIAEGHPDQALSLYLQSLKDTPNNPALLVLTGELYESQNDHDRARVMYQKALDLQPNNPLASNNLAYVMMEQGGNVDMALNLAQTARRGMPDSANAADTLCWAFYQKGIYQSAIDQFQVRTSAG